MKPGVKFDAGICVEVFEHLTPNMLREIMTEVAQVSNPEALYVINTGLAEYTMKEDPGYIDPFIRGHVISWTVAGVRKICEELGFKVFPIRGKTWAFALEYKSKADDSEDITDRIWGAVSHNLDLLCDDQMGSVLKILGLESVRAYL